MKEVYMHRRRISGGLAIMLFTALLVGFVAGQAQALTISAVGSDGAPIANFRWTVEEDTTHVNTPGVQSADILSADFHVSYAPVVATGREDTANVNIPATKRYFVTVLPESGYSIGGAQVAVGQAAVTITCQKLPLPTAQVSVFVFEDKEPLNNSPDLPQEQGLEGFTVILEEAGGRFGISGGRVMQDAFGNPIGTEYQRLPNGDFVMDGDGNPVPSTMGEMFLTTDANGRADFKYLPPAKYGIVVIPPAGEGWQQVTTIEGTPVIDAWVKADETNFFREFGPATTHIFQGWTKPIQDTTVLTGGATVTGTVVNLHTSRLPDVSFWNGAPLPNVWVALNDTGLGAGRAIYAQPADVETGDFSIDNVPPGTYQLVVWDTFLDIIINFSTVVVDGTSQTVAMGEIPVFKWFGTLDNYVFFDMNENGMRDAGEMAMMEQNVNIRFRDGSIYLGAPTDIFGNIPFEEVFPFFHWLVAEVDFARFKATGATIYVDAGGQIPADPITSWEGKMNPQAQPDNGGLGFRVETGPVLTQAFQLFAGQTNVIEWGKAPYSVGENGGISGIVFYATTRAEHDPRWAVGEPWEPGIPRVQVNLYEDNDNNGVIDDLNGDGGPTLADVDNFPFDWSSGGAKGAEDVDRNGNGVFNAGDAIQVTWTDSWDDSKPTGCPGDPFSLYGTPLDCFDSLRNFNQVRPGVFDGGYAFASYFPGGMDSGSAEVDTLLPGLYIVEATTPPGYMIMAEESKNVDFGDTYTPSKMLVPAFCVGDNHTVPAELTLFPGVAAPFAGESRPLCDRKQVFLSGGANAATDFFLYTEAPIAGHIVGLINSDVSNEWNPDAPNFGEKYAPPWLPISVRDWTGREVARTYSDEFGAYNALVPSTFSTNLPMPSGMSPNMLTVCLNQAMMDDPANPGQQIPDPFYNPKFSQTCLTFQYMPGTTTYLDTPVLATAAFANQNLYPLDCEFPDGTPVVKQVDGPQGGPWVSATGQIITIQSLGQTEVLNPAFDPTDPNTTEPVNITRDFGFGATPGTVKIGNRTLQNVSWTDTQITGTVRSGTVTGELLIQRGDNLKATVLGSTVWVISPAKVKTVTDTIQAAVDAANPGDLVLVPPGNYEELVILYKDVAVQGYGAPVTFLSALNSPPEGVAAWRTKIDELLAAGAFDILPNQNAGGPLDFGIFTNEQGAAFTVVAKQGANFATARIDGLTISGASGGGGVFVNGYARNLKISNNKIIGNSGAFGGGIRLGHPTLVDANGNPVDSMNRDVSIHNNQIVENGGFDGSGGGIAICNGAQNYSVRYNFICGNFSGGSGAGIGHLGLSDGGLIDHNVIAFNQSFNQQLNVNGGGIAISGLQTVNTTVTPGAGDVTIDANLIQGNNAGAGDGGGIFLGQINGADITGNNLGEEKGYTINVFNNMVVNNVSALAGAGISLQDAIFTNILHNTIAHNDSIATAALAFENGPSTSTKQPSGVVARAHSTALAAALAANNKFGSFSNPSLINNIIWKNRSFHFSDQAGTGFGGLLPDVAGGEAAVYMEMGVLGVPNAMLDPRFSTLTDTTGYHASNFDADPLMVSTYFNGDSQVALPNNQMTNIGVTPAFDEGGNFIDVRYGPLTISGSDYHLFMTSPARDVASKKPRDDFSLLERDIDGQKRPYEGQGSKGIDVGADEWSPLPGEANLPVPGGGGGGGGGCFISIVEDFSLGR